MQITNIKRTKFKGPVYNIGVKSDESYVVEGIKVKNCRGIWAEILKDEEQKPDIDGVPQSLRDRFGDATNDLVQPKKPMTKKNTLARKYLDKKK